MNQTKKIALGGLLTALVAVATMSIKVPLPTNNGYLHLGDSMIYLSSILFGWKFGLIAGGLGSALADLFSGYAAWAVPSLIIKGIEGLIIGKIAYDSQRDDSLTIKDIIATLVGGSWMILGYYLFGVIVKNSFHVPLSNIPGNIIQAISGAVIAFPIIFAILRSDMLHYLKN
ncbi:MAG: ECF transporter S component [Bacillota bacterium]